MDERSVTGEEKQNELTQAFILKLTMSAQVGCSRGRRHLKDFIGYIKEGQLHYESSWRVWENWGCVINNHRRKCKDIKIGLAAIDGTVWFSKNWRGAIEAKAFQGSVKHF